MTVMSKEVQEKFENAASIALATVNASGYPNVDPMGMRKVIDPQTVYISDQFFKKTLVNLRENAKVAVTFWDDEAAYQIHGIATYIDDGEQFAELKKWADDRFAKMGKHITAKGGVLIKVEAVYSSKPGPEAGERLA